MLLAIDYGTKRIGLALADENVAISLPFKEILNRGIDLVVEEIKQIVSQEKVSKIIVGLPISLKGIASQKTKETKNFIDILAKKIDTPVVMADERLSSKLADTMSLGTKGSRDVGAAMIILEDYLARTRL